MAGSEERLPRWDLASVYPGFDSSKYLEAKARLTKLAEESLAHLGHPPQASSGIGLGPALGPAIIPSVGGGGPKAELGDWLARALELEDSASSLGETLASYAYARYSTSTRDARILAELNAVEELLLPLKRAEVLFKNALAARAAEVRALAAVDPRIKPFAFHLEELLFWQAKQMSPELEDLAEDLSRSGGEAWARLQEALSSTTSVLWDERTGERKTIVQLRSLAYDPERPVREKAFRLELEAWKGVEIPLASALNGVKGFTVTLNSRRGWASALDKSIEQARMSRKTLDSLIAAMEESLPIWRRYLKAKAKFLGTASLAFYDLFAPIGPAEGGKRWSFAETREYIVEKFSGFDPAMGDFAREAFGRGWIDAEPREGKVGGAYCIDFPDAKAARVLCNFDGSFSALTTVAHELGHAWHHECVKRLPHALTQYPMTLAETASIFAETLVFEAALSSSAEAERLGLVEGRIQDGCQLIVDILSRFYFESEVLERRRKGELSPEELCGLMLEAQKKSYGEGLEPGLLHPYMWAVKGHYYNVGLSFYNFPYAFGLLFALGLYARYREEGPAFAQVYRGLLADTGSMSAEELCRRAGFDIESPEFWKRGISVFARQIEEFERLASLG